MLVLIIFHLIEKRDGKIIEGSEKIVSTLYEYEYWSTRV